MSHKQVEIGSKRDIYDLLGPEARYQDRRTPQDFTLQPQLNGAIEKIQLYEKKIIHLEEQTKSLQTQRKLDKELYERHLQALKSLVDSTMVKLQQVTHQKEEEEQTKKKVQEAADTMQLMLDQMRQEVLASAGTEGFRHLDLQNKQLAQDKVDLQFQIENHVSENQRMQHRISDLQSRAAKLQADVGELKQQVQQLQTEKVQLQIQLQTSQPRPTSTSAEFPEIKDELERQIKLQQNKIKRQESELEALRASKVPLHEHQLRLEHLQNMRSRLQSTERQMQQNELEASRLRYQVQTDQAWRDRLQEMLKARDLGEVVTSVGGLQEQLHELHERCNRHMKEIDSLRSQLKAKGNAPEPAPQIQEQQDEGVEASGVPGTESCSSEQLVHISRDLRHVRSAYMEIAEDIKSVKELLRLTAAATEWSALSATLQALDRKAQETLSYVRDMSQSWSSIGRGLLHGCNEISLTVP